MLNRKSVGIANIVLISPAILMFWGLNQRLLCHHSYDQNLRLKMKDKLERIFGLFLMGRENHQLWVIVKEVHLEKFFNEWDFGWKESPKRIAIDLLNMAIETMNFPPNWLPTDFTSNISEKSYLNSCCSHAKLQWWDWKSPATWNQVGTELVHFSLKHY